MKSKVFNAASGMGKISRLVVIGAALGSLPAISNAKDVDGAYVDTLQAKGDHATAYNYLLPLESDFSGQPMMDYRFALAALETGNTTRAIFAFERVVALTSMADPLNAKARTGLAKAYQQAGEFSRARREFEKLKAEADAPDTKRQLDGYLDALATNERAAKTSVRGYLETTLGYDSNVNAATAAGGVAVPSLGGQVIILDRAYRERSDNFGAVGAGASVQHMIDADWTVSAGVNGNARGHASEHDYNQGWIDGYAGVGWRSGKHQWNVAAQANTFNLNGHRYRDVAGGMLQWQYLMSNTSLIGAYAQYGHTTYADYRIMNVDRSVVGLNGVQVLGDGRTLLFGGLYSGREAELESRAPYVGNHFWGVRFGGQHEIGAKWTAFATVAYEDRRYDGDDPDFLRRREDDQWTATIGANWQMADKWRLTPRYDYLRNRSNVELSDYRRDVFSLTVRREF